MCVVRRAAERAVRDRILLPAAAERLISEAMASKVLPTGTESSDEDVAIGRTLCAAASPVTRDR